MSKQDKLADLRQLYESNLYEFARVVYPNRYFGDLHKQMFAFWSNPERKRDQLTLVPRDHQKSVCMGIYVAWIIIKDPTRTFAYVTGVSDLAQKQTRQIKEILESTVVRYYWPDMLNWVKDENSNWKHVPLYKWNENEFEVYHPKRRESGDKNPTVKATSVGSSNTGFHFTDLVFDDIVTEKNFDTEAGRKEVEATYAAFSSIASTGSLVNAVGTPYHPKDIYQTMMDEERELFDENDNFIGTEKNYEVFKKPVETEGVFVWPRTLIPGLDKSYGFNWNELSHKKSKYKAAGRMEQFYAQYYLEPNDPELQKLSRDQFQYYNEALLKYSDGKWRYKGNPLNTFAAMDVAYTDGKYSDYTAIAVIGLDSDGYIYILDLDRFKTNKFHVFYERMIALQSKWSFRKIQVETNAGGSLVAQYMKDAIRENGANVAVEGKMKIAKEGKKRERIAAIIEPRYESKSIFHPKSGMIGLLEEEVVLPNPSHDDLVDALASAIEISKPPAKQVGTQNVIQFKTHSRFGGRVFR